MLATNAKTGKTSPETVSAVLVRHDTSRYNLTIKVGNRTAVAHTTSSHLFWDATSHRWVKAGMLRYGARLRAPHGGTTTAKGG